MENTEVVADGDDQSSGWLEVKRRNRSSNSKIPIHNVSRVSSSKAQFSPHRPDANRGTNVENSRLRLQSPPCKVNPELATNVGVSSHGSVSVPSIAKEPDEGAKCFDKKVVLQVIKNPEEIKFAEETTVLVQCARLKENLGNVPKIKWGDLEDDTLTAKEFSGNVIGGPMIIDIDGSSTEAGGLANAGELNPHDSSLDEGKGMVKARNEQFYDHPSSSMEVNEMSPVQVGLLNPDDEISSLLIERTGEDHRNHKRETIINSDHFLNEAEASSASIEEKQRKLHCDSSADDNINPEEGEVVESKERFRQRLWCFLFENLNRAVDELYLHCELECDMEQIEEAILVIEESNLDFKELKSRVERFDNTKKCSSQGIMDGMLVNAKEHRRLHAVSWEVRRMISSSHRAEILSSSLEAFKRIQQEKADRSSTQAPKLPNHESMHLNHTESGACVSTNKAEKIMGSQEIFFETAVDKQNVETKEFSTSLLSPDAVEIHASNNAKDGNCGGESPETMCQIDKPVPKKDRPEKIKRQSFPLEKEKRSSATWKSMDAWKEKRNWVDILKSPLKNSSKNSRSPSIGRKNVERARNLHDKLMLPDKKKKSALDMKREADEKHARALRIRNQLENERVQRLQRTSEKLNRVNEWQAVRSLKLREGMHARQQQSESRHEAYLAQVAKRAGDESSKVNEVRFITSLNEGNKKLILRQKLYDNELRRAEKLKFIRTKQKEDNAKEEAVLERRKLLEAEKLQRLAETQRRKEEAQLRREEERKASSAAREAKAVEQLRRKEDRAKAQQEEAELLAQKLAEKLSESEQRRKFYLEQIRERASMDFRDQSSPLLRRCLNKEGQIRSMATANIIEDYQISSVSGAGGGTSGNISNATKQQSLKRRIKKIRQRLMALKYEFVEPPIAENVGFGCRVSVGSAKVKIGRWLQELQRLRQARKEGVSNIGLIVGYIIKFLEGKEPELHASRQAGLIDFIASAMPASHTPSPDASQVTIFFLRLMRVVLSVSENRSYFLSQNLLPPIIPMLSTYLEKYIKVAASCNLPGNILSSSKVVVENLESVAQILEGLLWIVSVIIGHVDFEERNQKMQDGLVELVISYKVIHHLRDLFALYYRPQTEGSPFPSAILLSLKLLTVLTSRQRTVSSIDWESLLGRSTSPSYAHETPISGTSNGLNLQDSSAKQYIATTHTSDNRKIDTVYENEPNISLRSSSIAEEESKLFSHRNKKINDDDDDAQRDNILKTVSCAATNSKKELATKQPVSFLLSVIGETSLVSLPSLLTAVLLQANTRLSSDQASCALPSNFEEVATAVLKILNNLAFLDIDFIQNMLARTDLKMEFFHLTSFLLSHGTSKWKTADDQIGLLLLESLSLLCCFALLHPGNQTVLSWGKSPTILHKICDLPFVFFSDPELTPILAGTLMASCYGCDQNRDVVQQEVSMDMLLSLLKSCRQESVHTQHGSSPQNMVTRGGCGDGNKIAPDAKKSQANHKITKNISGKGVVSSGNSKVRRSRAQRDSKGTKCYHSSSSIILYGRFPSGFINKAEEFFAAGSESILK